MSIAASVKKFLDSHKVPYRVFSHQRTATLEQAADLVGISKSKILKAFVLEGQAQAMLAILPLDRQIDFIKIKKLFHRTFRVLPAVRANRFFVDCESGSHPPFGEPYGMQSLIDKSLDKLEYVYFEAGSHTSLVQISIEDFYYLNSNSIKHSFIGREKRASKRINTHNKFQDQERIMANCSFPNLPGIAQKILHIANSDERSTEELAELVARDETINQQILSYARLPFLAGPKSVEVATVKEAINHVLGFDNVSHIALGLAAGRVFKQPQLQIELKAFWRHAFFSALLSQKIAELVNIPNSPEPCMMYLAGLMHNFGLLLFAKMYPPEFRLLNKWSRINPKISMRVLEKRLLGMGGAMHVIKGGHAQLGAWLLNFWDMPESVIVTAREHHTVNYQNTHKEYVNIVKLSNQVLRQFKIGDGEYGGPDPRLLAQLGLDEQQLQQLIQEIMVGATGLDHLAGTVVS